MTWAQRIALGRVALRYPRLTLRKLRRRRAPANRPPAFPPLVQFFLHEGCNLRCAMCGQWRRSEAAGTGFGKAHLPLAKLTSLIDEAAPHRPEIYVWGGEPTLHPDFLPFVAHVKRRGLLCTVNTNGTLLGRLAGGILDAGVDSIDVSIDGPKEVHDAIRGARGTYRRVMAGLEELRRGGRRRPLVKAVVTLSEANLDGVEALLDELDECGGVDMSIVQLGWFVPTEAGRRYERRMRDEFGVAGESWRGFADDDSPRRAARAKALLASIRRRRLRKPILFFPEVDDRSAERYYTHPADTLGRQGCRAVDLAVDIRPNGDVVICADFPDLPIGNVNEQTIAEIWNGAVRRQLRDSLRSRGLLGVCPRCCGLFK